MKTVTRCRVCGNSDLQPVLDLGSQPLSCSFPEPTSPDPMSAPLELLRCTGDPSATCGTVQLRHSADVNEMYGKMYGYRSSTSRMMRSHLQGIVARATSRVKLSEGDVVLDIGCNDGTLLKCYPETVRRLGIDPSAVKFAADYPSDIKLVFDFFSFDRLAPLLGTSQCKIITSIAMFYDLEDPLAFMRDIRKSLAKEGIWVVELSHLASMYWNLTYDQICHEHLLYLGLHQLQWMAAQTGLKIIDVSLNYVNGGSFAATVARDDSSHLPNEANLRRVLEKEKTLESMATHEKFARRVAQHRDVTRYILETLADTSSNVVGYGASTKGNIILNYCGISSRHMKCIRDAQPHKNGLVTPGTRIPIVSPEIARDAKPNCYFVFIWHLRKEIIEDEMDYIMGGGKLVFHLPMPHVIDKSNYARYLNSDFDDLSFEL